MLEGSIPTLYGNATRTFYCKLGSCHEWNHILVCGNLCNVTTIRNKAVNKNSPSESMSLFFTFISDRLNDTINSAPLIFSGGDLQSLSTSSPEEDVISDFSVLCCIFVCALLRSCCLCTGLILSVF